jgi:hypothetical protein
MYESIHVINENLAPISSLTKFIESIDRELDDNKQKSDSSTRLYHDFKTQEYSLFLDNFLLDPVNLKLDYNLQKMDKKRIIRKKAESKKS